MYFNPRSREGSDFAATSDRRGIGHFNPRSREGSDQGDRRGARQEQISIHAPAKGATIGLTYKYIAVTISIHAPAKGATHCPDEVVFHLAISIHAPAKGATPGDRFGRLTVVFQSTLPRRERQYAFPLITSCASFQSTLPRRERPVSQLPQRKDHGHFNPRSREGSDRLDLGYMLRRLISIHAPAKGATCGAEVAVLLVRISIHAPAKGATRAERTYHGTHHNFNPRSREGSDEVLLYAIQQGTAISIHAPAKGATPDD